MSRLRNWRQVTLALAVALSTPAASGLPASAADSGTVVATVTVQAVQLDVELHLTNRRPRRGKETWLRARVTNHGAGSVGAAAVELMLTPGLVLKQGLNPANLELPPPGSHEEVRWRVCAAREGAYLLVAVARAGGTEFTSNVAVIAVRPPSNGRDRCT